MMQNHSLAPRRSTARRTALTLIPVIIATAVPAGGTEVVTRQRAGLSLICGTIDLNRMPVEGGFTQYSGPGFL